MGSQSVLFARHYRAALLDHLLNRNEAGLARALALGRRAVSTGLGLLHVVHTHHDALHTVLRSTRASDERLTHLKVAQEFLLEAIAVFEMTHRGFVERLGRKPALEGRQPEPAVEMAERAAEAAKR